MQTQPATNPGPETPPDPNWITDANGNRNSISWFGSREAAQRALDSLTDCKNCTNCSRCSDCSGCSNVAWLRAENGKLVGAA